MFNNEINKTRLIVDMIDRFIVRGRNSDYDIDVLICGTVNDYVWIKKYDLILSKRCLDFTSPHVACMTICPKKRNINGDSKNDKDIKLISYKQSDIIIDDFNDYLNDYINEFINAKLRGEEINKDYPLRNLEVYFSHYVESVTKIDNTEIMRHMESLLDRVEKEK